MGKWIQCTTQHSVSIPPLKILPFPVLTLLLFVPMHRILSAYHIIRLSETKMDFGVLFCFVLFVGSVHYFGRIYSEE